ncbi:MAG: PIN domain-containing protein [Lautropia sp.]
MLAFVDTNLLICWRDAGQPRKQPLAAAWLEHLWETRTGRLSTQVLSEYYTNVCHKLRAPLAPSAAWADVTTFLAWNPCPIDGAVLARAREVQSCWQLNWWDCLIVAAAQIEDCALLLTEDLQDGMKLGSVTVRDPFRLSVEDAAALPDPVSAAPRRLRPGRRGALDR